MSLGGASLGLGMVGSAEAGPDQTGSPSGVVPPFGRVQLHRESHQNTGEREGTYPYV